MAYHIDKTDNSIVIDGWEQGIAPSPHKGIGSIKCANISTEIGEVMCNYARSQNTQDFTVTGVLQAIIGSTTQVNVLGVSSTIYTGGWIVVSNTSNNSWLANGTYFITTATNLPNQKIGLSAIYNGSSAINSDANSDTAVFAFLANTANSGGIMSQPVQGATEQYRNLNGIQYRYYIMDTEGHVWVYDTATAAATTQWQLIDISTARLFAYGSNADPSNLATGMAVYLGWLFIFIGNRILVKETCMLGTASKSGVAGWDDLTALTLNTQSGVNSPHFALTTHENNLIYCDTNFIGSIQANTQNPFAWSYAQYTFSGSTLTISILIGGMTPYVNMPITFSSSAGTLGVPSGVTAGTIYFVKSVAFTGGGATIMTFTIAATVGGTAISLSGGSGTQFYNTFDPNVYSISPTSSTFIFTSQALTVSFGEITQSIAEIGSQILIGCQSNALYQWDNVSSDAQGVLFLPESNTVNMITVNNMAYILSGSRGNIYITNGNTASAVASVPDYTTGLIDPSFVWGGIMYARGRIWFSIQDQNASHTGTCGGIWSFVPTQNLFIGQDTGTALRLEHESSYNTYNGMTNVLLNINNQNANGLQYFSAWTSDAISPTYGIDNSSSSPYAGGQTIIETDFIPMGTYLDKASFTSVQTKYATPLVSGESVQIKWRKGITNTWTNIGTDSTVGSLGARFPTSLTQLIFGQFQIILTGTATTPSFTRFMELSIKK